MSYIKLTFTVSNCLSGLLLWKENVTKGNSLKKKKAILLLILWEFHIIHLNPSNLPILLFLPSTLEALFPQRKRNIIIYFWIYILNSTVYPQSYLPLPHISAHPVRVGAVVCHAVYNFAQTSLFSNVYTTLRKENIYLNLDYSSKT